jgi:hypothetical protein
VKARLEGVVAVGGGNSCPGSDFHFKEGDGGSGGGAIDEEAEDEAAELDF